MKPLTKKQHSKVRRLRHMGCGEATIASKLSVPREAVRAVKCGAGRPTNGALSDERIREVADYLKRTGCGVRFAAKHFRHSRDTIAFIRHVYLDYEPPKPKYSREEDFGTYQPTEAQIAADCLEIQKTWSETERWMRQVDKSMGLAPNARFESRSLVASRISCLEYNTVRQGRTGASHLHQVG